MRKHFPENLFLGPEQLEVIICKSNRILIRGEPGTGKTSILLALLFIHTAKVKHNLQSPNFKKVLFVIHWSKTEFIIYIEAFIDKHCDKTYAKVMLLPDQNSKLLVDGDAEFILFDECPTVGINEEFQYVIKELPEKVQIVWSITYCSTLSYIEKVLQSSVPRWRTFHLKNAYRYPTNIALRYTKIRRKFLYQLENQEFLPFFNCAPHFIDDRSAIKILNFTKDARECEPPQKQFVGESLLLVTSIISSLSGHQTYTNFNPN